MAKTHIKLDSKVSQTKTAAVLSESKLSCTKTSAKDVYAHAIWVGQSPTHQYTLSEGDSCLLPRGTLTIWIFRENTGNEGWAAEFELADA